MRSGGTITAATMTAGTRSVLPVTEDDCRFYEEQAVMCIRDAEIMDDQAFEADALVLKQLRFAEVYLQAADHFRRNRRSS